MTHCWLGLTQSNRVYGAFLGKPLSPDVNKRTGNFDGRLYGWTVVAVGCSDCGVTYIRYVAIFFFMRSFFF